MYDYDERRRRHTPEPYDRLSDTWALFVLAIFVLALCLALCVGLGR